MNRDFTLTVKHLLIIFVIIAMAIGLAVWFVMYRLEKDSVDVSDPTETVTLSPTPSAEPTPEPTPEAVEIIFDNSLTTAITIVANLTDDNTGNDAVTESLGRNNFLKKLASQVGSTGEIIGGQMSNFAYYTEWYIGSYEANPDWNKDTPWCASYISWCLEQVNLSVRGTIPRYANVDNFMAHFTSEQWLSAGSTPTPGDMIFFGSFGNPNHMGVVLATEEHYVYTIEGNTNNVVGIRKYLLTDPNILGYGVLDWNN